jgi:hypothetical protein
MVLSSVKSRINELVVLVLSVNDFIESTPGLDRAGVRRPLAHHVVVARVPADGGLSHALRGDPLLPRSGKSKRSVSVFRFLRVARFVLVQHTKTVKIYHANSPMQKVIMTTKKYIFIIIKDS